MSDPHIPASSHWLSMPPSPPLCLPWLFAVLHLTHPHIHPNRRGRRQLQQQAGGVLHPGRLTAPSPNLPSTGGGSCRHEEKLNCTERQPSQETDKKKPDLRLRNISQRNTGAIHEAVNIKKTAPSILSAVLSLQEPSITIYYGCTFQAGADTFIPLHSALG